MTPSAPATAHMRPMHTPSGWRGWLAWLALLAMLLAVFGLYMQPDFLLTLADQLWSCL